MCDATPKKAPHCERQNTAREDATGGKTRIGARIRVCVVALDDEIPSPINVPPGCAFHPRCPLYAMKGKPAECREKAPHLRIVGDEAPSLVSCHFAEETDQHLARPTLQDDGPQTPPSA